MTTRLGPVLCTGCQHLTGAPFSGVATCHAYPQGIPDSIWKDAGDHRSVREDQDNEIVFELLEGLDTCAWLEAHKVDLIDKRDT